MNDLRDRHYLGLFILFTDPSMTVDNVTKVFLLTKGDWNGDLGIALLVPKSIRDKIEQEHSILARQKRALMEYWVQNMYNASWESLAGVLYYTQEEEALFECKTYLTKSHGLLRLIVII